MQNPTSKFYQPYTSDSEDSASITSADTSDTEDTQKPQQNTLLGSLKSLVHAGSITLPSSSAMNQVILKKTTGARQMDYSQFDLSGNYDTSLPETGTKFDMQSGTYTSILMINSRDRDSQVYAQPTYFTIRLPRTYRNVTSFQITQMKLLSSFFYFRPDKKNVALTIQEQGRTLTSGGQTVDNIITVTIRTGTYNIQTLLSEIQTQLNRTPLFFYYPNGFSDYITLFTAAGDLTLNFNQPGDNYYDSLTDTFIANPTMKSITQKYFASTSAGLSFYTLAQVKVAYYYPVLYEMILDPAYASQLNLNYTGPGLLAGETVRSRIIYTFQGLNDQVVQGAIDLNLAIVLSSGVSLLDNYRTLNTFLYSLVNEYTCTYQTNNNLISIATNKLNTSLNTLLTNQTTYALANQLNLNNLTVAQYSNLIINNSLYTAVFTDMYNTLQKNFATYFAVNFGTYSPSFYTNVTNAPYLQNGIGATGVTTGYSLAYLQNATEPINSSTQNLRSSAGYWPQLKTSVPSDISKNIVFVGSGLNNTVQDLSADTINVPYSILGQTVDVTQKFIDNSGNLYISPTLKAGDIDTPIYNGKYTVFRFRSFVRQTLQVETLPLPYYYRFPAANSNSFTYPIPTYFDISYSYINSPLLIRSDISNVTCSFASSFTSSIKTAQPFLLNVRAPVKYYSIIAPPPKDKPTMRDLSYADVSGYKYPLNIIIYASDLTKTPILFTSAIQAYLYHDQGAFFADISGYRNENPYHYKQSVIGTTDLSSVSFTVNAFAKQTYYLIIRSQDVSFQNTIINVVTSFPDKLNTPVSKYVWNPKFDPFSTIVTNFPVVDNAVYNLLYANEYDTDFIRLPTSSNIQGNDPSSQSLNQNVFVTEYPIGYDISGVSTDLTDYRGFTVGQYGNQPASQFRQDPTNQYTFQEISPYSYTYSNYLYSSSSNAILNPVINSVYTPSTVNARQYKIVHWYDNNYIAPQRDQKGISLAKYVANAKVFDASYGMLNGYIYDSSGTPLKTGPSPSTNALSFDSGVIGLGFLPSDSIWTMDQVVFKTAYMPAGSIPFTDPNKLIKYLGVFQTPTITNAYITDISLNQAMFRLKYQSTIVYTTGFQSINSGFDTIGGSYHQFINDTAFTPINTAKLSGYTPTNNYNSNVNFNPYIINSNNYYSIMAFDSNQNIIPFYTLMGSYTPNPNLTFPYPVTRSLTTTTGDVRSLSIYYPSSITTWATNTYTANSNPFTSQYEQSIPITTTLLHTQSNGDPINTSNSFYYFPTDISVSGSFNEPKAYSIGSNTITLVAKGPYFIMVNRPDFSFSPVTNFVIGSNVNIAYPTTSYSARVYTSNSLVMPLSNLDYFGGPTVHDAAYKIMGFTANNMGTTDTDGVYVFTLETYRNDVDSAGYIAGFSLKRLYFGNEITTPYYGNFLSNILCSKQIINGGGAVASNSILTLSDSMEVMNGLLYNKAYYTDTGILYYQFQTCSNASYPGGKKSRFGVYNSISRSLTNFCRMDPSVSGGSSSPFAANGYFWDGSNYSNTNIQSYTLDWTVDSSGWLYILNGPSNATGDFSQTITPINGGNFIYFSIKVIPCSNGLIGSSYFILNGTAAYNSNIYTNYKGNSFVNHGVFNQIRVDSFSNIFLQQQMPPNIDSNNLLTPIGLYPYWNSNFVGKYAKINYIDYSPSITASLLTNASINTLFSISQQTLSATSNDVSSSGQYTGLYTGEPLFSSDMLIGISKNSISIPGLYFQTASVQGLLGSKYTEINGTCATGSTLTFASINGSFIIYIVNNQTATSNEVKIIGSTTSNAIQPKIIQYGVSLVNEVTINTYVSPRTIKWRFVHSSNVSIGIKAGYTLTGGTSSPRPILLTTSVLSSAYYTGTDYYHSFNLYPPIWGNSESAIDRLPLVTDTKWQVLYPTVKIVLRKLQNSASPITDLTDLSNYATYPHTSMFFYDSYANLSNDLFNKFGRETKEKFKAYDVSSGYNFYSYINNIKLSAYKGNTSDISANKGYNYLAVRGYSPTEKFRCLTRFYLPNRYDFGFITLQDLSDEMQTVLVDLSGAQSVNPTYQTVLNAFNNSFKGNFTFGSNAIAGFAGSNYTFTGFPSFLKQYLANYAAGQSNADLLNTINSNTTLAVKNYINTYLSGILPSYVLNRQRFTDPLLFSIPWKSSLSDVQSALQYEWGLGYNLGYPKQDTPYDTIQIANSFFKILDDYIYLKLNPEFTMNRMDTSSQENLRITHEPTGQTNQYAAKLLLAPFGQYATTLIQNPIAFNPTLTSLDKLSFQWVDLNGSQINNADCEWNMVVQIMEQVTQATPSSVIPKAPATK